MLNATPVRRTLLGCSVLALSCTPVESPPGAVDPTASVTQLETEADPDPQRRDAPVWRWTSPRAVGKRERGWQPGLTVLAPGQPEVTMQQGDGVTVHRNDAPRWTTVIGADRSDSAAAVLDGDAIFVAHHRAIATGASVVRLSLSTGSIEWDHPLRGVGPIGHSKYANDVQVQVVDGGVHVYGWESGGAYVEVLDPNTGTQRYWRAASESLVRLTWAWTGDPEVWSGAKTTLPVAGLGELTVESEAFVLPDGRRVGLPQSLSTTPQSAAVMHDGQLFVAWGHPIASGATLSKIDVDSATVTWTTPLAGLGPIDHSQYFNDLQISVHHNHIVVYGNEAAGRYLEAVDPATGRAQVNKRWKG